MKLFINVSNDRAKFLGPCLTTEIKDKYTTIYRACSAEAKSINPYDYVTRSKQFAVDHMTTCFAYHEEPQHVLRAVVETKYIFNALNPGEYFYVGPPTKRAIIVASAK